jgi:hypothetical protein
LLLHTSECLISPPTEGKDHKFSKLLLPQDRMLSSTDCAARAANASQEKTLGFAETEGEMIDRPNCEHWNSTSADNADD